MRRFTRLSAQLAAALLASALLLPWLAGSTLAQSPVRVAATLPALAALAKQVGGDHVEVTALSSHLEDPHFVDARPSRVVVLNRTDLLLLNGLDLEIGWLPPLLHAARNPRITPGNPGYLDASTAVAILDSGHVHLDRSMGDIHPGGNPHYALDARALRDVALALGHRLAELRPDLAAVFRAQADETATDLTALAIYQVARFQQLRPRQRRLVSYHESLAYLLNWLDLRSLATLEPKPGIPPSPAHVAAVLSRMRREGVRVIVQEAHYPLTAAQTVARLTEGQVVQFPGGPDFAARETVEHHLQEVTDALFAALSAQP